MLVPQDPTDTGLNRYRQGLPPSMLRIYEVDHTPSFTSSIPHSPLIAPPDLILNHSIN
jgi:hypothetical protein